MQFRLEEIAGHPIEGNERVVTSCPVVAIVRSLLLVPVRVRVGRIQVQELPHEHQTTIGGEVSPRVGNRDLLVEMCVFSCNVAMERTPFYGCCSRFNHSRLGFSLYTQRVRYRNGKNLENTGDSLLYRKTMNHSGL